MNFVNLFNIPSVAPEQTSPDNKRNRHRVSWELFWLQSNFKRDPSHLDDHHWHAGEDNRHHVVPQELGQHLQAAGLVHGLCLRGGARDGGGVAAYFTRHRDCLLSLFPEDKYVNRRWFTCWHTSPTRRQSRSSGDRTERSPKPSSSWSGRHRRCGSCSSWGWYHDDILSNVWAYLIDCLMAATRTFSTSYL